jgi:hypothetical protein
MEIAIIPKFIINRFISDDEIQIHLNVLLSSNFILIFLIFIRYVVVGLNGLPHFCLFQRIFGIPCPGCGITRSFIALSELNIASSWHYNPVGIFIILFILIQIPMRVYAMIFINKGESISSLSKILSNLIVLSLLIVWIIR